MTVQEAQEILRRCRPDTVDTTEPEVVSALELARQDPELAAWWVTEQAWQREARASLRGLEPPAGFRESLKIPTRRSGPPFWRRPEIAWGMAAGFALLLAGVWWLVKRSDPPEQAYGVWRQRMARTALREYRMDVVTNNLVAVEDFLTRAGTPAKIVLPVPVRALSVVGGAALRFQNRPVSMFCFDRGGGQLLWLFAIDRSELPEAPGEPRFAQIGTLATLTWLSGERILLMAVEGSEPELRGYL